MSKEYAKMNLSDLETAETFFENDKHLDEFIANVIRYYLGKTNTIKTPIVKKYFNLYKSTMDFVLNAKKTGIEGQAKKAENQALREATLEGLPKGEVEGGVPPLISSNNSNNSNKIKEEINTEASPSFSEIPFSESEDIPLEAEEEKRKKVAPKKEKEFAEVMKSDLEIAYDAFVEMRKKKKGGVTEYALKLIKDKLVKLSNGDEVMMIAILNKSTINSWSDIFPITDKPKEAQQPISKTESLLNNTATLLNKYQ